MTAAATHAEATSKARDDTTDLMRHLAEYEIIVQDVAEVSAYLLGHDRLAGLLPAIGSESREILGRGVELSLEVYSDPEVDDRYLTLYARALKYEPDFLEVLQTVNDRFSQRLEGVSGYLLVATDFSRPRGKHVV